MVLGLPADRRPTTGRDVSRRINGRHRRRGPLRRAAPAVATAAGSVALVTTIGTAAFWLVPSEQRPGGSGPRDAAPPTAVLIDPTGDTSPSPPETRASSDAPVARDAAARRQAATAASRSQARASAGERSGSASVRRDPPRPRSSATTPPPRLPSTSPPPTSGPLPSVTPPLVTTPILPTFLSLSATGSLTGLP